MVPDNMSGRTTNNVTASASRRSARSLTDRYDNDNAELIVDLRNIRKLLNFKTNRPDEVERPHKRLKREQVKCVCSLTIWDNRPGGEAVVKRNVSCTLTSVDNGVYGPCVLIYLEKTFVVRAGELKVNVNRDGETVLEVIDNYFLEFKIIPSRPDIDWPPIPLLGKSDGDHYAGEKLNPEALKGALVMKYKEIPKAPDSNVPLKTFFLQDGITFKTKYGLEVAATWRRPGDESNLTNGLRTHTDEDVTISETTAKDSTDTHAMPPANRSTQSEPRSSQAPRPERSNRRRRKAKMTFHFESNTCRSQEVLPQYRTAEITDFRCPACPKYRASDLDELRFHFLSSHIRYNFALVEVKEDEEAGEVLGAVFEVTAVPPPKPSSNSRSDQKIKIDWERKASHFDLAAFLDGDTTWSIDEASRPQKSTVRRTATTHGVVGDVQIVADLSTDRRLQNNGFLPMNDVRDFHQPQIKKHSVIKLIRRIDDRVTPYTSLSHRATSPSEEPVSDSDDEIDQGWLNERHLEELEIAAKENAWNPMKRELFRRWDEHRLNEKLEHTRYISDSLIRFVRREKYWLANHDTELQAAFQDLLAQLTKARFIDARVVKEIQDTLVDAREYTKGASATENNNTKDRNPNSTKTEHSADNAGPTAPDSGLTVEQKKVVHMLLKVLDRQGDLDSQTGLTDDQYSYFTDLLIPREQLDDELRIFKPPPSRLASPHPANPPVQISSPSLTPEQEISAWRASVLSVPLDHCGSCSQPILKRVEEGIHCSATGCGSVNAWFHLKCVKLKKRRLDWVCRGCRAEMRLKMRGMDDVGREEEERRRTEKGKGKERAVE